MSKKYRNFEITVRGQSKSLKMVPFDTLDIWFPISTSLQ